MRIIRIETRFACAGISLMSVMWMFLLDGEISSIWPLPESLIEPKFNVYQSYWVHGFLVITLKGPKSLRTPAWLSDIRLYVALIEYYFLFGVYDGRERLKNCIIYLKLFCVFCLLPIYCSVTVLFILNVKESGTDQRERTMYRFLICWIRASLVYTIKLWLCEIELYSGLGGCVCVELQEHVHWVMCIMQNLQCNHHYFI